MKRLIMMFSDRMLSRSEMMSIKGGYDTGDKKCTKSCTYNGASYGCYSNMEGQSPACLCIDRAQNDVCKP